MKIALAGTESTGKTTLAKLINKRLNIPYINEYARETCKEMGMTDIRESDPETFYKFQINILDKKLKEEKKYDHFISDRSTADNLVYYLRWVAYHKSYELNDIYAKKCINNLFHYDAIILCEPNIPLKIDGVRTNNIWYRESIHFMIKGILEDYIDYDIMPYKNLEDRYNFIVNNYFLERINENK